MKGSTLPYTIAVIGAGASGVLVATQLMQQAHFPFHLLLVERRPFLGRGIAYSTSHPNHLLNLPVGRMSAFPDLPNHFIQYLMSSHNQITIRNADLTNAFVPRFLYGPYLQSVLEEARSQCTLGTFEHVCDEAIALFPSEEGMWLQLRGGKRLHVHQVVLACGFFPPHEPSISAPAFSQSSRYYADFWSTDALADLKADSSVLLLGTGLTMVDAAVALHKQGHTGPILALSRHGLLPFAQSTAVLPPTPLQPPSSPLTALQLLRWIRTQVAHNGNDWRPVVDGVRSHARSLWQSLPMEERLRFFRHAQPYWNVRRHRMAPAMLPIIESMSRSSQLQVYAGRLRSYEESADDLLVTFAQRKTGQNRTVRVGRIINCTGPKTNIWAQQLPLFVSLLQQGLVCPDALDMGLDVTEDGALVDAKAIPSSRLWTLGPLCLGSFWETGGIPEIRQQAANLASKIWQVVAQQSYQ